MKKLGIFALLLSMGMFSFGCSDATTPDAGNGNGTDETAVETPEDHDAHEGSTETETPAE